MPRRAAGAWPLPWLGFGFFLLSIVPVFALSADHYEYSGDDQTGLLNKSWDVIAVDVDVVDIVSVRRIDKLRMTAAPLFPDRNHVFARKVSSTCPSSFSECPASLSGGCCPTGFACDVSDCIETAPISATTTQVACGRTGYTGCGVADGGGCCPIGYTCGRQFCTPPAGATESHQCPTSYYLCPSSLNYGCCLNTMGCALNGCYATTPSTIVFTATFTTTTDSTGKGLITTVTSTTVETPSAPTATAGAVQSGDTITYVAKLVPTTTAKASLVAASGNATGDNDGGSGGGGGDSGLTSGEIGGIIGGLVGLLIAVAVASYCIIRNLRRTSKAVKEAKHMEESNRDNTASGSGSRPLTRLLFPAQSGNDHMRVNDELLDDQHTVADGEQSSSVPIEHSQQRASTAVGTSTSGSGGPTRPSVDGTSSNADYFGIPQRAHNLPGRPNPRISVDSRVAVPGRPRGASDASEPSTENTRAVPAELDTLNEIVELPVTSVPAWTRPLSNTSAASGLCSASFGAAQATQQQQQPLMATDHSNHQRDWSGSSGNSTGYMTQLQPRPQPRPQPQPPQQPSAQFNSLESVEPLHGHYGPSNEVAGQTRAGIAPRKD